MIKEKCPAYRNTNEQIFDSSMALLEDINKAEFDRISELADQKAARLTARTRVVLEMIEREHAQTIENLSKVDQAKLRKVLKELVREKEASITGLISWLSSDIVRKNPDGTTSKSRILKGRHVNPDTGAFIVSELQNTEYFQNERNTPLIHILNEYPLSKYSKLRKEAAIEKERLETVRKAFASQQVSLPSPIKDTIMRREPQAVLLTPLYAGTNTKPDDIPQTLQVILKKETQTSWKTKVMSAVNAIKQEGKGFFANAFWHRTPQPAKTY